MRSTRSLPLSGSDRDLKPSPPTLRRRPVSEDSARAPVRGLGLGARSASAPLRAPVEGGAVGLSEYDECKRQFEKGVCCEVLSSGRWKLVLLYVDKFSHVARHKRLAGLIPLCGEHLCLTWKKSKKGVAVPWEASAVWSKSEYFRVDGIHHARDYPGTFSNRVLPIHEITALTCEPEMDKRTYVPSWLSRSARKNSGGKNSAGPGAPETTTPQPTVVVHFKSGSVVRFRALNDADHAFLSTGLSLLSRKDRYLCRWNSVTVDFEDML